jgi:hypothetical protein
MSSHLEALACNRERGDAPTPWRVRHTSGMGRSLNRRSFLAALGGLSLAAACGTSSKPGGTSPGVRPTGLNAGLLSIEPFLSTQPQRLAFALVDDNRGFVSGAPATLAIQPPGGVVMPAMTTRLHTGGLPKGRGVYVIEVAFPTAGIWQGKVHVAGHPDATLVWQVNPQPVVPIPGGAAVRAASPTTAGALGVDPICTRQPACPLHTVSLDKVIGSGTPVAVMFATPARCQSRYCGPVLDQLLSMTHAYEDRIHLVHVEIYKDSTSNDVVPTVNAWSLPGEPWLFGIDRTGKVTERLDGAMSTDEVKALLDGLLT